MTVCNTCHVTWGGLSRCHCCACHITFSSVRYFDQHRWSRGKEHGCWHPSELRTGGLPLVCRDGVWGGPEMSEEQKLARFG